MRTTCIFIAALAALATIVPARAADPIRHIGFESDADLSGLSLAENTWPVTLRRAVDAGEAAGGRASLLLAFRFRKAGYCYPMFPLKQSIRLEDGPVYFSGCLKILEQHPEAWHNWCFTVFGEYPKKAAGWKGFEVRVSSRADLANGWQYFYSGDLREAARANAEKQGTPFEGAVITGFYAAMWNGRPGEVVRYRVDEARFTRENPVPAPDAATYREADALYREMMRDRPAWEKVQDPAAAEVAKGLDAITALLAGNADGTTQALVVGKVREIERSYWRLKLLQLADE